MTEFNSVIVFIESCLLKIKFDTFSIRLGGSRKIKDLKAGYG